MGRKKGGIPGLSFSWKRALGVSQAKSRIARATGIPTTRSGQRQKIARELGCSVFVIFGLSGTAAGLLIADVYFS